MNQCELAQLIHRKRRKAQLSSLIVGASLLLLAATSVTVGWTNLSATDVLAVICGKITGNSAWYSQLEPAMVAIIWDIRFPRILCAILVGCGLAVSGTVFQAILMNPLADSYTMGVSTGAAFGASLAIFCNLLWNVSLPITPFAFGGALLTLFAVLAIARVNGHVSSTNLIIAGIIVGCFLSAAISLIKSLAGEEVAAIVSWLIGSLSARGWPYVTFGFPLIIICYCFCHYFAEELNILSLGDQEARNLGIDSSKLRIALISCGALLTAVCVSISGIIGFVGLVVPHLLRMLVGSDNKLLIPLSALSGGLLLLAADTFARSLDNIELPVGVLTTLLGGPFFFYLFKTRNKSIQ